MQNYIKDILNIKSSAQFNELALKLFHYQVKNNAVYKQYVSLINVKPDRIKKVEEIPFLPINFFKNHKVLIGDKSQVVFSSSGTSGSVVSKHYVRDSSIHSASFNQCFKYFYQHPENYNILALLPSYIERKNSSLVYMVSHLMQQSNSFKNGFYMRNLDELNQIINELEKTGKKTLLFGVSFALLDFAEKFPQKLSNTTIIETGGMKGRRKEMIREELHLILKKAFDLKAIHSEYGMTELLSQAYSYGNGVFNCPPHMKVFTRNTTNPLELNTKGKTGALNIIDLANIYSCAFIATQDLGRVNANGSFEVLGRFDDAEVRGCNLMYYN